MSGGVESPSSSQESDGDRLFAADFQATQPSPSYDQSAVYRQGLLSQAPALPGNVLGCGRPHSPQDRKELASNTSVSVTRAHSPALRLGLAVR